MIYCTAVTSNYILFIHKEKIIILLGFFLVALALSDKWRRSQIIRYGAEMHVHSCTPSVSMHIETVSLTQNIIHPLSA